jgi:hypothetical protein
MEFTPAFYCHHAGGYNILILKGSFVCRVAASSNKAFAAERKKPHPLKSNVMCLYGYELAS